MKPLVFDYYGPWRKANIKCKECGWVGKGSALEQGQMFAALFEVHCPACDERVAIVNYPSSEQVLQSPEAVEGDRIIAATVMTEELIQRLAKSDATAFPVGTRFFDWEGIPIAVIPTSDGGAQGWAFDPLKRPFNPAKALAEGTPLTEEQFRSASGA